MNDLLTIAFKDMPGDIVKAPAYSFKDNIGSYAIELPAHVVVAVKTTYSVPDVGLCVSIPQEAITEAQRLGYEIILYVHAKQKYYLTNVSKIKKDYIRINRGPDRPRWVVPFKAFTEHSQAKAKANAMQGVLF